jgi:hypothetical protein
MIMANSSPGSGGLIIGGGGYSTGLTATLSAAANLGYAFLNWTEGGTIISTSPTFSFVTSADRTLVANFVTGYSITTSASPPGTGVTSGDGSYAGGSSVTVEALPSLGYAFVNWTQDGSEVSNAASYTFVATGDRDLVANFYPRLSIARSTPGKLVLAWPGSAYSYAPQQNDSFDPDTWVDVTDPIQVVDGQYQVAVTPSASSVYYRLYVPQ